MKKKHAFNFCLVALTGSIFLGGCNLGKGEKSTEPRMQNATQDCMATNKIQGKEHLDQQYFKMVGEIKTSSQKENSIKGMVLVKGGQFEMGGDVPDDTEGMPKTALPQGDELPKHTVEVSDFYMDSHEVTVGEFWEFIKATGYVTVAEKDIDWDELKKQLPPNTPKPSDEMLQAGSLVFSYAEKGVDRENMANWWTFVKGANWKRPEGEEVDLETIRKLPVTQVSWYDALAYAKWMGKRLPTEAEFEYAMRGGIAEAMYPWGNETVGKGVAKGNFLQGDFPYNNTAIDGFGGLAPVGSFPPNGYGLYDMAGNVWEWTLDWYSPLYYKELKESGKVALDPNGPAKSMEVYATNAMNKVVRGGSFLCNDSWCSGYRNARRMRLTPDSGMGHVGFRLVRDAKKK